eukprot:gene2261-biopygen3454
MFIWSSTWNSGASPEIVNIPTWKSGIGGGGGWAGGRCRKGAPRRAAGQRGGGAARAARRVLRRWRGDAPFVQRAEIAGKPFIVARAILWEISKKPFKSLAKSRFFAAHFARRNRFSRRKLADLAGIEGVYDDDEACVLGDFDPDGVEARDTWDGAKGIAHGR